MIIAGAIGGALPDIDYPSGNGAVSSLGKKAGQLVNGATGHHARFLVKIGAVFDALVTKPLVHLWLAFASGVLAPFYTRLYDAFGKDIGWSPDDPSEHRGGLTHSLVFMAFTTLIVYPIAHCLAHDDLVWAGLELGILSHLFADSVCKSGIKWFWPWLPKIGFYDETHEQGNGIRLLPVSWCMSTGKCPTREDYMELGFGTKRYKEMRGAYYKEKGWQWFFKAFAVIAIVLCVTGMLGGTGGIAWGAEAIGDNDAKQTSAQRQDATVKSSSSDDGVVSDNANVSSSDATNDNANANGIGSVAESSMSSSSERKGPTSLTAGDLDASTLPKGIIKLPDESLWVVGVGQVSTDTLDSPTLSLSKDEKARLLAAATAQRMSGIPDGASSAISNATSAASNAVNEAVNGASNVTSTIGNAASNATSDFNSQYVPLNGNKSTSGTGMSETLSNLFGGNGTAGFGFLGLTPYTSKPSN